MLSEDLNVFFNRVYCAKTCASCMRFVIKCWWFSAVLDHFSLHHNDYLTSIVPESQGIVQVVQTIEDGAHRRFASLNLVQSICYEKTGDWPNKNRNFTVQN